MKIEIKDNSGLTRVLFEDSVGNHCIAQTYKSTYGNDKLRIGVHINYDDVDSTPMCLDKSDALILLPMLQHFIQHGTLPFQTCNELLLEPVT